ncbi:class I SAM-dependent methyltransferase [Peredibacter sp. HCB2-198]|uniref:class I SAM-dependent methyltransferase n=1 Tax=Peredibacter sp. HCB2-198 TaxID=3383025 RepID=UPI0038B4B44A
MKYLLLSLLLVACSSKRDPNTLELPETIAEAVDTGYRTPENRERDKYRHPVETLNFFGLKPEMTVVEVAPGTGWYMEILAPFLANKGRYIMASPVADKPYFKANEEKINAWKAKFPNVAPKMESAIFSPPSKIVFPADGTADMVLTFRNVHNWMMAKGEDQAFNAFYKVLKPGGVLGVVEHRALPTQEDPLAKSGYVREQDVIEMATKAGFKLVATSEINANPKDTKNHPEGVWTLPPTLKLGDKDREKYLSIGESDRMTLKFIKPKN